MTKQLQTTGARKVRQMIKNGDGIRTITAFAKGYGFNLESPSSLVYINRDNQVCTTVNGKTNYNYVKEGF